jgi:hypothetical protein
MVSVWAQALRDTVASTKPVRTTGGAQSPKDHLIMNTSSRFAQRYGAPQRVTRTCSTPGCGRTAPKGHVDRCHTCTGRLRRFGHPLQTLPASYDLDTAIRRMETQRASVSNVFDFPALEHRWQETVDVCRGNAEPSYRTSGRFTHNKWDTAAAAIIRDVGEALPFTRIFDSAGAMHLLQIERGAFRSDAALEFCTLEALRRAANIGRFVTEMRESNGTIRRSFRKEVDKNTRAAAAKLIRMGIGVAALALAKREAARADKERVTRASYWQAVQAIEAAPV